MANVPSPASVPGPGRVLAAFRLAALAAIALVITAADASAFAESYRGLWLWATHHRLAGLWAAAFPVQVDAFIVVGELSLFIAMTDRAHMPAHTTITRASVRRRRLLISRWMPATPIS